MAHQRKTAADYGQLSLFEEPVPEWLQPPEPLAVRNLDRTDTPAPSPDDDDDLSQFMSWLQKNKDSTGSQE